MGWKVYCKQSDMSPTSLQLEPFVYICVIPKLITWISCSGRLMRLIHVIFVLERMSFAFGSRAPSLAVGTLASRRKPLVCDANDLDRVGPAAD